MSTTTAQPPPQPQPPPPLTSPSDDHSTAPAPDALINSATASADHPSDSAVAKKARKKKQKKKKKPSADDPTSFSPTPPTSAAPASNPVTSPSVERDSDLLYPFSDVLRLHFSPHTGRYAVASHSLPPSSLAILDRGYARAIRLRLCTSVCALCHTSVDSPLCTATSFPPCPSCHVASYCSDACAALHRPHHLTECRMLAEMQRIARLHSVDVDLLQMLAGVCGRHHRELHRADFPYTDMKRADTHQLTDEQRGLDDELVSAALTHTERGGGGGSGGDRRRAMTMAICI